jgi:hypothetical protein
MLTALWLDNAKALTRNVPQPQQQGRRLRSVIEGNQEQCKFFDLSSRIGGPTQQVHFTAYTRLRHVSLLARRLPSLFRGRNKSTTRNGSQRTAIVVKYASDFSVATERPGATRQSIKHTVRMATKEARVLGAVNSKPAHGSAA